MGNNNNEYLYVFLHIPKCAGSTFLKHIQKNFDPDEAIEIDKLTLNLLKKNSEAEDYLKVFSRHFSKYSEEEKNKVKIIYGHTAAWGVHKNFNKKARYFTFVRDPLKRTASFYNYYKMLYLNASKTEHRKVFYKDRLLVNSKVPNYDIWLREKYGNDNSHFSLRTMNLYLKKLGYLEKDNKDTKSLFSKLYFVGLTEKYERDAFYIYSILGINKFFINQNVSKKYITIKELKQNNTLAEFKNKRDLEIYKTALDENRLFRLKEKQFYAKGKEIKRKRKVMLPITQLLLDFKESLRRASSLMRTKSSFYETAVDKVKKDEN